jgi:hypothetical protein
MAILARLGEGAAFFCPSTPVKVHLVFLNQG